MKPAVLVVTLLLGQLVSCEDLLGKVFSFPVFSDTAHVKLFPLKEAPLYAFTACLRFLSDTPGRSLFSLATRNAFNALHLVKYSPGVYRVFIQDQVVNFMVAGDKPVTEWNHLCATWESASGQAQVWVNSVGSMWKGISRGGSVGPLPSVVLGQDQDNYGGGFNIDDSFQGQISDVHLWDHVLQPCQIHGISQGFPYLQGNVLNWRAMSYSVGGYVIVGQKLDLRPHSSCAAEKQWAREAVNTTETSMSNEI